MIDYSEKVVDELASMDKKPVFGAPKPFRLGVMLDDDNGVVTVESVTPNSAAEKAGLQKGDVIVEMNGEAMAKRRDISRLIRRDAGKTAKFKLKRGETEVNLNIKLKND